jgi:hypothetical protein
MSDERWTDDVQGHVVPHHPLVAAELVGRRGDDLRAAATRRRLAAEVEASHGEARTPPFVAPLAALVLRIRRATS